MTHKPMSRYGVRRFMGQAKDEGEALLEKLKFQYMDLLLASAPILPRNEGGSSPAFPEVLTSTFQIAAGSFAKDILVETHDNPQTNIGQMRHGKSVRRLFSDLAKKSGSVADLTAYKTNSHMLRAYKIADGAVQSKKESMCLSLIGNTRRYSAGIGEQPVRSYLALTDQLPLDAMALVTGRSHWGYEIG